MAKENRFSPGDVSSPRAAIHEPNRHVSNTAQNQDRSNGVGYALTIIYSVGRNVVHN